jgi:hypothetical protein
MESEEDEWSPLPSGTEGSLSSDDDDAWVDDDEPALDSAAAPATTAPQSSGPSDAPTDLNMERAEAKAEAEAASCSADDQALESDEPVTAPQSTGQREAVEAEAEAEAEEVADEPGDEPNERGFDDYTLASPWERFVAGVEAVLRKWFDTDAATLCARAEPSQYAALRLTSILTRIDFNRTPHTASTPPPKDKRRSRWAKGGGGC